MTESAGARGRHARKRKAKPVDAAAQSERRFRALTEKSPDAICILDAAGIILYENPASLRLSGDSAHQTIGRNGFDFIHPDDVEHARRFFQEVLRHPGLSRRAEMQVREPNGAWRTVDVFAQNFLRDPAVQGVVVNWRDITELKKTQQELKLAKEAAEAASLAKSRFLANMSHELRTPLTAILGFADLLSQYHAPDQKQGEYLDAIQRNALVLLQLIDELLDLSKIEAGKLAVAHVDVSPWRVVDEVLSVTKIRAEKKGLELRVECQYPLPASIKTDPARLRQILVNLVGNAIKFTEHGEVRVVLSLSRSGGPSARLRFAVHDTGIGMSAEATKHVFEPFTQADASVPGRFGGFGLGLAISRRLAELLRGEITVASDLGIGSTFMLTLDAGPLEGAEMLSSPPPASLTGRETAVGFQGRYQGRVLLAEDDPDIREAVWAMLRNAGAEVDEADNGLAASGKPPASVAEGRAYDLILMDMQMPQMDGYEATRRLRSLGWTRPVVALTAHAMPGDREKCLEAGCDDYLAKPITQKDLAAVLARYLPPQADLSHRPCTVQQPPVCRSGPWDDLGIPESHWAGLLAEFVQGVPKRLDSIDRAMRNEDGEALAMTAHALAGAAAVFGFAELTRSARKLQEYAKQPAGLALLPAAVEEVRRLCQEAVNARPHESPP